MIPFDYWQSLSEDTAVLIQQYGSKMVKSSRVFSDQLSYGYAVLFVNDRIVKYVLNISTNKKIQAGRSLIIQPLKTQDHDKRKCLYDHWLDGEERNLNKFTQTLFQLFQYADGTNKAKILEIWSGYFTDSRYF